MDPFMNRHKPASDKTQDISHVLASIFKDLYTSEVIGKDIVSNLSTSRNGGTDHHVKYVEELQQVHLEYNRQIENADMLEKHIIQARVRTKNNEDMMQARILEEVGESYQQLGLPPAKSAFKWYVDNKLLKRHNLICPQDYLTAHSQLTKAPQGKTSPGFTQPNVFYSMPVSTQPQDDGYTKIPQLNEQNLLKLSEISLATLSSEESSPIRNAPQQTQKCQWKKTAYKEKPTPEDKAAMKKFKERQNFLRNPHFQPFSNQRGSRSLVISEKKAEQAVKGKKKSPEALVPIFIASPPVVLFTDYQVGQVYETTVELRNMTSASRHVRVIPPTTSHFSVGLGRFPGNGGFVAPGMSCQYTLRFAPDSLADYEDILVVETQSSYSVIPLGARRPPPILTLPAVLDLSYCLVGGVKFMDLVCRNDGQSAGTFCIMPKRQWPVSSFRTAVKSSFAEEPPFAISPSLFTLFPGQALLMEVVFFPTTAKSFTQSFTIVCDNCQVKDFIIQGAGQQVMLELVALEGGEDLPALGELLDLTADRFVRFEPINLHSSLQKKIIIKNNTHLDLPFHWHFMKPNLQYLQPGETPDLSCIQHHAATDKAFSISPAYGQLAAAQEHVFLLTYHPQELRDYHSVCHLVIRDVPDLQDISQNSECQHPDRVPKIGDVIVMEIEVKGSTEPYKILLEPYAIFIPGDTYIHTTIRKSFRMWNHSKSAICFHWERISDCHSIEAEPSSGTIEMNECCDMDLVLTGGQPGSLRTTFQCRIQHHPNPISLAIDATFKGPSLTVSVPSLDLGLVQLGQEICYTFQIRNSSPLEACWDLKELPRDTAVDQEKMTVEPSQDTLLPLESCSVNVLFKAMCCQRFQSVLQLTVQNGTGCLLPVRADVLSPQVCLLSCKIVLDELYVGISQQGKATLFNQTLLPAHFTWRELQGSQAHLCDASFMPSSGNLAPNAQMEITVSFTAHTDEELNTVAAVCEVEGMEKPLLLGFCAKAKSLMVSYSLPHTECTSDGADEQLVILDFTEHEPVLIGKSATRQLLITNHTAITAPFTIETAVFNEHHPLPSACSHTDLALTQRSAETCASLARQTQSRVPAAILLKKTPPQGTNQFLPQTSPRVSDVQTPLHDVQAEKMEKKEHADFIRGLLGHGKGATFSVEPQSGTLESFKTVTINITAVSNMWGDYQDFLICKVGDLEPTHIPIRLSVRGCPIYFQLLGPQSDNQNQGPIIRFGTHVSGGDTVSRSLRLNNTSPYDIRMDWLTYNKDPADRKIIDLMVVYGEPFPLKDADGNEVVGGLDFIGVSPLLDQCQTSSTDGTSFSPRTKSEYEDDDEYEEEDNGGSLGSVKNLITVIIKPHEGNASDYPYCITPQQIVVPAGGSSTINVSFTPLTLSDPACNYMCVGYALGFMSLDSKVEQEIVGKVLRAQGPELEPLRLDMLACVNPATLTVQMEEDDEILKFSPAASDLLDGNTLKQEAVMVRSLQLINNSEVPLSFRLITKQPFSVLHPRQRVRSNSESHTHGQLLLQPKRNTQVRIAFHLSASLLSYQTQSLEEVSLNVELLCSEGGERRLSFQQDLIIQYSNNSVLVVPLYAQLALPTLHLSCCHIDFQSCYVGQTILKEVYLYNRGGSSSFWTALIDAEEESDVFRVTPNSGLLKPLEYPVCSCRQVLEISFTPSNQKLFQATVTMQGVLGEPCLTLEVQGSGSFDERYVIDSPGT